MAKFGVGQVEIGVGILGAVRHEERNPHLSHYHGTSGLAQICKESVCGSTAQL